MNRLTLEALIARWRALASDAQNRAATAETEALAVYWRGCAFGLETAADELADVLQADMARQQRSN